MPPPENANAEFQARRSAKSNVSVADNNITAGFRQVEAAMAELRARGVIFAVFALSFDEEREKLREGIEALLRKKALERRRKHIALGTHHARWLAGEFSRTGTRKLSACFCSMSLRCSNG